MKTLSCRPDLLLTLAVITGGPTLLGCGNEGILLADLTPSPSGRASPSAQPDSPPVEVTLTAPETEDAWTEPTTLLAMRRADAEAVLFSYCYACHGTRDGTERFDASDIDALIDDGYLTPSDPEESLLVVQMRAGLMPPPHASARPSSAEIDSVVLFLRENEKTELEAMLTRQCDACHGREAGLGNAWDMGNLAGLVEQGLLVPGDRSESRVYIRMSTSMPPAYIDEPRPTPAETERVGRFIDNW